MEEDRERMRRMGEWERERERMRRMDIGREEGEDEEIGTLEEKRGG